MTILILIAIIVGAALGYLAIRALATIILGKDRPEWVQYCATPLFGLLVGAPWAAGIFVIVLVLNWQIGNPLGLDAIKLG